MAASLHTLAIVSEDNPPGEPVITSGAYALELIQRQTRRLGKLQAEVLADRDPEPLHQLRVSGITPIQWTGVRASRLRVYGC